MKMKKSIKIIFLFFPVLLLAGCFIFSNQVFAKSLSEYPKSTQIKIEACSGKGNGEKCLYYGSVKGICNPFDEYFLCEKIEVSGDNLGQLDACAGKNICNSCQFSGSYSGTCSYIYVSADYKRELYCYLKSDGFTCMEDSDCSCFGSDKICKPRGGYGGDCVDKVDNNEESDEESDGGDTEEDCDEETEDCDSEDSGDTVENKTSETKKESSASTKGCCVKDTSSSAKKGTSNCVKNTEKTTTCSGKFFANDPDCNKAITSDYCGGTFMSSTTPATSTTEFINPLKFNSLSEVLVAVLVNLQSFLALIAIIIIIVGGIMYMFSSGNETMITRAKTTIGGALIGLAIILAAPSFLKQIKLVLGGGATGANADEIVNNAYSFRDIAISVINFLLSVIGILGIIALVVGGVMYVTAYGSEERVEMAKKIIGSALIGILIAFGALILVKQIAALLGAA